MVGVDPWGRERNAANYPGPDPVVCHPPCGPWSKFRHFCIHQDPALAIRAVKLVRRWGGVLEHPAWSKLWHHCGMPPPGFFPDAAGGISIGLLQSRFGHPAPKETWVYIVGATDLPALPPARAAHRRVEDLSAGRRARTPPEFARWLVAVARSCNVS